MSSDTPPDPVRFLEQLENLLDQIIQFCHSGQWSKLLLLVNAIFVFLGFPELGIAYKSLSKFLPEQYPVFFWLAAITVCLIALLIRYFDWDRPILRRWVKFSVLLATIIGLIFVISNVAPFLAGSGSSSPIGERLSWGGKFLIQENPECRSAKESAVVAFNKPDYKSAEDFYQQYLDRCKDESEAQIYLSNTKALQTQNPIRIVVSIPISRPRGAEDSEEILRGVAIAQSEWNAKSENRKFIVGIADDGYGEGPGDCGENRDLGECGKAQEIARLLVKQDNILGVIGHFSSDATEATAKIYEAEKLVAVSPTSTAVRKNSSCSNDALCLNSYIFRTASNDSIAVEKLIQKMPSQIEKVGIIYEGQNTFSRLFKATFAKRLSELQQNPITNPQPDLENPCNFSMRRGFDVKKCLSDGARSANALLLVPSTKNASDVNAIIDLNYQSTPRLALLGADSMYKEPFIKNENTKEPRRAAEGMLVVVSWHRSDSSCDGSPNRLECKAAKLLSETKTQDRPPPLEISWRTATAYDATQSLLAGLKQASEQKCSLRILNFTIINYGTACLRRELKDVMLGSNFEAEGALGNGKIKFDSQGDRLNDTELGVVVEAVQGTFKKKS